MTKDVLHDQYLAMLKVPTKEEIATITKIQEAKEKEIDGKYHRPDDDGLEHEKEEAAAGAIQRTYRGFRERKRLRERGLDPSTRWLEALKEARYRALTVPHPRQPRETHRTDGSTNLKPRTSSEARRHWQRVNQIAQRARGDPDDVSSSGSSAFSSRSSNSLTRASHHHLFHHKHAASKPWTGKMMDLTYFLELVDIKHRYGANLKIYHAEWKKAATAENFFYWLDYGEGKDVDLPGFSRATLEKEQVRYLSREERQHYLVKVDADGLLCWSRSGNVVDTGAQWKDSLQGIVSKDDKTPEFTGVEFSEDSFPNTQEQASARYPDSPSLKQAKGLRKFRYVTPATIMNHLMRSSIKENTWIFVFSTAHDLYVSLKTPGTFQHSSFLHGSRILAAGLLTVSNGQLTYLSPLSGHYRPPSAAFKHFINWLKEQNVDMSKVHLSKSYAVLVGLEAFVSAKAAVKSGVERITDPKEAKAKRQERQREKQREIEKHRGRGIGMEVLGKALDDVKRTALGGNGTEVAEPREVESTSDRNSRLPLEDIHPSEISHLTPAGTERGQQL